MWMWARMLKSSLTRQTGRSGKRDSLVHFLYCNCIRNCARLNQLCPPNLSMRDDAANVSKQLVEPLLQPQVTYLPFISSKPKLFCARGSRIESGNQTGRFVYITRAIALGYFQTSLFVHPG